MKTTCIALVAVVYLAASFAAVNAQQTDGGEQPEPARPDSGARRGPPVSWEQVLRTDADRDGKISKSEFRGPPTLFGRRDTNSDGFLTKEEFDAARTGPDQASLAQQAAGARQSPRAGQAATQRSSPPPTKANVSYGTHARQVVDFWQATSRQPTPLVLYIHGGGFLGGSKNDLNARDLNELLDAGISVASIEYRVLADAKLPAAHEDVTRALQVLRSKAQEWNLDATRVGAFGGSAGAQLVMYLAFHDDLADPSSDDPVARQSSRLACVAPNAGQVTMDMKWWVANVPEYGVAMRNNAELFGTSDEDAAMKINAEIAALSLITRDDPPVFMSYSMAPGQAYPDDPQTARNWKIHHVVHGLALKKLCDQLGVEAHLKHPGAEAPYASTVAFLKAKLLDASAGDAPATDAAPLQGAAAEGAALQASAAPQARQRQQRPAPSLGAWAEPRVEPEGMKYETFKSKAAATDVSYLIYLPPGYETDTGTRYPVVYWLHGRGGGQTGASQLVSRLDGAIREGKAPAMIVVGVNGLRTSSFVDSADGKTPVQTVIVEELIPHIDATYRTIASRSGRAIEGFSMGGAGAPKIGFKRTDLFGAVSILAGALHDLASYKGRGTAFQDIYGGRDEYFEANSPWNLVAKNADAIRGKTTVRIVVGDKDGLLGRNTAFHQLLDELDIPHDFTVVKDAPHSPGPLYDGTTEQTWSFYAKAFGDALSPSQR